MNKFNVGDVVQWCGGDFARSKTDGRFGSNAYMDNLVQNLTPMVITQTNVYHEAYHVLAGAQDGPDKTAWNWHADDLVLVNSLTDEEAKNILWDTIREVLYSDLCDTVSSAHIDRLTTEVANSILGAASKVKKGKQ